MHHVDDVFKIFDKDGSNTIEKEEAIKHWSKNFGKISANEFFNTVDYNHDGQIQYEEFVDFWRIVKGVGHTEEEIREEVTNWPKGINLYIVRQNQEGRDLDRIRQLALAVHGARQKVKI